MSVIELRAVYFHPASFNLPRKNMIFFLMRTKIGLEQVCVGGLSVVHKAWPGFVSVHKSCCRD